MFSKTLGIFVSVMMIQSITSQSIGVYNAANLGNTVGANAVANTAVAAETAAITGNSLAYANAYPGNSMTYPNAYPGNLYAGNAYAANGCAPYYGNYASPLPVEEIPVRPSIPGLTYGLTLADLVASKSGGLRVMSSSPIAPTGISVQSDNMAIEGPVAVSGQLPFLGVVALEGPLPAVGHGAVGYGCGNGNVGIVSEGITESAAVANANAYANVNSYANAKAYANANAYANGLGCNGFGAGLNTAGLY